MILVTHGFIGAAIGRLLPYNPLAAFALGAASHFLSDAIPHWHYPLLSQKRDKENPMNNDLIIGKGFLTDLVGIGLDCALGLVLPIIIFQGWDGLANPSPAILAGAIGGILPDPLQFLYMKWKKGPIVALQRFHMWIHAKTDLDRHHLLGIGSQFLVIVASILISQSLL